MIQKKASMGLIFLNLAENRENPERPFAFLATYAIPSEVPGRLQHIPLARVLKDEAEKKQKDVLRTIFSSLNSAAKQCSWLADLVESRKLFQPQAWTAGDAYRLLQDIPRCEAAGIHVRVPDWWGSGKRARPQVKVELGLGTPSRVGAHGLVDFNVSVALGNDVLTEAEWGMLLTQADGLVKIRGRWVEVDGARMASVHKSWTRALAMAQGSGIPFGAAMRFLVGVRPNEATSDSNDLSKDLTSEDFGRWSQVTAGPWLRETLHALRQPDAQSCLSKEPGIDAILRPYQAVGINWLWHIYSLGLGAILADDMGLGKTLQVLALLTRVKRLTSPKSPSLLIVPASLIGNWMAEAKKFAPLLQCRVVHNAFPDGTKAFSQDDVPDLVITSYGLVTRLDWLSQKKWNLVILDEAQAIKNPTTKQALAVRQITAHVRIAMTGTPIENRLSDLWSLFHFAYPSLLGSTADFRALTDAEAPPDECPSKDDPLSLLRRLVSPYILRRLKTDKNIISDLPPKTEMTVWCGLAPRQAALYAAEVTQLKKDLEELGSPPANGDAVSDDSEEQKFQMRRRGIILGYLTRFKQICNHPAQATGVGHFSLADSGKLQRLYRLAENIADQREKVLIFTQFQSITGMISSHLEAIFGRSGLILTGATPVKERKQLVDEFQKEDGPPFFVLSLKAGGTGLNLTAASHVIHFDRWWNPAVENQATDRSFRIGQQRPVLVHKFVCQGTIEEKIAQMISDKTLLSAKVLSSKTNEADLNITEMTDAELLELVTLDIQKVRMLEDS